MKKDKRYLYYLLTKINLPWVISGKKIEDFNISLCHFCKYAEWSGGCSDCELECTFPDIGRFGSKIYENCCDVWGGSGDCSGFAPKCSREDCVDIVGLYLQGLHPNWSSIPERGRKK